ncbi:DEAD/DEAH box helicase family protein [Sporosarcina sp. FSL W8-0480]|uniref:DEAD/DEAH box helicase family protein n=1 Tax=Sporosarcina sp. FSL W8-0480 TaxID=2954701 RepID=UPI0030D6DE99
MERIIKELSNPEAEEKNELSGPLEAVQWKNGIHIKKSGLPSSLLTKLHDAASFHNPEFYKRQARRHSTYGVEKKIVCAETNDIHMIVPRGCVEEVRGIFESFKVGLEIADQRNEGDPIDVALRGELRPQQQEAVQKMLEQLSNFLGVSKEEIGQIGGGKRKQTAMIDVAMMQSLSRQGGVDPVVTQYGQVIVDECHHLSAFTFEKVMKQIRAKFVYGLTATLKRKDGLHPIITMQCGPIIYKADAKDQAKIRPYNHRVIVRNTKFMTKMEKLLEICNELIVNEARNERIFNDVLLELEEGRTPLILTERVQHVKDLHKQFKGFVKNIVVLSGNMKIFGLP